jgi:hypothetical protein
MATTEEAIDNYIEELKDTTIPQGRFDEYVDRVKTLRAMSQEG